MFQLLNMEVVIILLLLIAFSFVYLKISCLAKSTTDCFELCGDKVAGRDSKGHQWKKLSSEELGISTKLISKPTKTVLNGLRRTGYLVSFLTVVLRIVWSLSLCIELIDYV